MSKTDAICKLRKENGLPCKNCVCFEKCVKNGRSDMAAETIEPMPEMTKKEHKTLTTEEKRLFDDLSIPAEHVQKLTGRSKGVIYHYRSRLKKK